MLQLLNKLLPDPPPPLVFEIGDGLLTGVRRTGSTIEARARLELPLEIVEVSSLEVKIVDTAALAVLFEELLLELAPIPRPTAALLLPDAASKLAVLEFDSLPSKPQELRSLIEFRLKKTVPFDVRAARLSYQVQTSRRTPSVLVAATPGEAVWPFEELLREFGLHLGFISLSSASMLNLVSAREMTLVTKLSGSIMTMAAIDESAVRLVRSVESPRASDVELESSLSKFVADLYPTFVYIEDNLGSPVSRLLLAGFGELTDPAAGYFSEQLGCQVEALRSPNGILGADDSGIEGYLQAA